MTGEGFWPWWLGALTLGAVVVGYWVATGRPYGVSGLWMRVLRWREERALARAEAELAHPDDFAEALIEATREEFGDAAAGDDDEPALERQVPTRPVPGRTPLSVGVTFLVAIVAGGFLAALSQGELALHRDLGAEFVAFFGRGWEAVAVLVAGGVLIGFGTSMAGGCTSGHGMNGCASRQPGSIVATAAFMATGVAVSLLLEALL